jgi:transcription initiation factor IIE alpha subunit
MVNEITKQEATAVFYCDDSMGFTTVLAKYLGLNLEEVAKLMMKLEEDGFVESKPFHTNNDESQEVEEGMFWYDTTEKGKQSLKDYKGRLDV